MDEKKPCDNLLVKKTTKNDIRARNQILHLLNNFEQSTWKVLSLPKCYIWFEDALLLYFSILIFSKSLML